MLTHKLQPTVAKYTSALRHAEKEELNCWDRLLKREEARITLHSYRDASVPNEW
jgi:hypothetical protein